MNVCGSSLKVYPIKINSAHALRRIARSTIDSSNRAIHRQARLRLLQLNLETKKTKRSDIIYL